MKVLVPVKHVIDYNVQIQIKNGKVVKDHVKHSMNPFDEIAVEAALQLKEAKYLTEIHCISIGTNDVIPTLRHGLALGADQAVLIESKDTMDPIHVAKVLAEHIKKEAYDLVIMGKQAIDDDYNQTAQMLAGILNWSQATFASKIHPKKNGLEVTREVDGGLETIAVNLPAVISTDLRLNEPRFATLPNIMKAKSKPLTTIAIDTFKLELKPYFTQATIEEPAQRKAGKEVKSIDDLIKVIKEVTE
ncbi:MAG: electron transfer flavoprotein subunit beta [Legionellales bacterium]|jgi:electron transfer flavoprotein beta subunit|nr:electron transfer flavoprotein subunit beta [Legionellales bacterium]